MGYASPPSTSLRRPSFVVGHLSPELDAEGPRQEIAKNVTKAGIKTRQRVTVCIPSRCLVPSLDPSRHQKKYARQLGHMRRLSTANYCTGRFNGARMSGFATIEASDGSY